MLFGPKTVAFLLASAIASLTTAFLALVPGVYGRNLLLAAGLSLGASFVLIFLSLEFLVFREINKIYALIDKVKRKDFKLHRKRITASNNPLKKLNEEILVYASRKQEEIDELKRMEMFRREFVANISHELKTPIFAAQGFIHTLIDGAVDDKNVRDKFLAKAARSLDGLDALVHDLLTLSQMESGDIKMHPERCELVGLTGRVFEQLEEAAATRRITLKFEKSTPGEVWVLADAQRIGQVFSNLVGNAVKYGNEGGKVAVSLQPEKEHVTVAVSDDGPGIPPEHLKRIFERFYRVEKSRSKDQGGSGLGLAIVKHILEAHKSKVSVTSKPGKGTTFSFRLDRAG